MSKNRASKKPRAMIFHLVLIFSLAGVVGICAILLNSVPEWPTCKQEKRSTARKNDLVAELWEIRCDVTAPDSLKVTLTSSSSSSLRENDIVYSAAVDASVTMEFSSNNDRPALLIYGSGDLLVKEKTLNGKSVSIISNRK